MKIPKKVDRDTIAEAIFEIRFLEKSELSFELLLGSIYPSVHADFPKIVALPITQLPRTLVSADPNLRYQPLNRLDGEHFGISIGNRILAIHCKAPYQGWSNYKFQIIRILGLVKKSEVIGSLERISIKYVNVLQKDDFPEGIDALKVSLKIDDLEYDKSTVQLRSEIIDNDTITIVEILTSAILTIGDGKQRVNGVLVSVDTVCNKNIENFWDNTDKYLELVHQTEKNIYFNVLTETTLKKLGPEY